jgi:hypothetical protein
LVVITEMSFHDWALACDIPTSSELSNAIYAKNQMTPMVTANGASVLGPHECSIRGAKKEFGVDERTHQRIARGAIQAPQPLRLRRRQAKSGHLDVFAPNTPKDAFKRLILCWLRQCSPVFLK